MLSNDRLILVPSLAETGSELRGTSSFVKSQVKTLTKRVRTRRFGPKKSDYDELAYLVGVLAEVLDDLGGDLQIYDRYLKTEYNINLRHKTIEKHPHEA